MESGTDQLLVPVTRTCTKLGGVSRTMVYDLVKRGELVKVNIGRRGFITAKSLQAYVDRLSAAASKTDALPQPDNDAPVLSRLVSNAPPR